VAGPEDYPAFEQVEWLDETDALKVAPACEHLLSTGPLDLARKFLVSPTTLVPTPVTPDPTAVTPDPTAVTPDPTAVTPDPTPVTPDPTPVTPDLIRGPLSDQEWQKNKMDSGSSPERQPASPVTPDPTAVTPDPTAVTPDLIRGPFKSAVIFSSSSVETKQDSNNPTERGQVKGMLDLESELQHMAKDSSTKLVIFRPTLIYGCGLDTNISFLAKWIQKYGHMPVNGNAAGLRQPVHAQDLASVAINALLSEKELADVMFVGGGETLSYSNMVERIFIAMGKPVSLVRIPQWLFTMLVRIAGFFNIAKGINGEMVKRQRIDLVFDDNQAREMLNYRPRDFSPSIEDFSLPDFENIGT